jgi:hypothetical protein
LPDIDWLSVYPHSSEIDRCWRIKVGNACLAAGDGVAVRGIGVDKILTDVRVLQAPKKNVEAIRMIYARVI